MFALLFNAVSLIEILIAFVADAILIISSLARWEGYFMHLVIDFYRGHFQTE